MLFGNDFGGRTLVNLSLDFCIYTMRMFFEWRRDDNYCIQCWIPLQLNCKIAPGLRLVREVEEGGGVGALEASIGGEEEK